MVNSYPQNTATTVRIVIADDHPVFRSGLSAVLGGYAQLQVIGQAGTGNELVDIVEDKRPDLVLTDINMPSMCGIMATGIIRKQHPQTNVIALSMHDSEDVVLQMVEAGAKGYLLKSCAEAEMVQAIQTVSGDGLYYCATASDKIARLLVRSRTNAYNACRQVRFSERDLRIIRLLCQQQCSKEIAAALNITSRAVDGARERIQEKIGARNMIGIALYAIQQGLFLLD